MIRTKTTLVVGAGVSAELQFPDSDATLARIAGALDFARLGTSLESDDMRTMAAHIEAIATAARVKKEALFEAGQLIRSAARLSNSIDSILEQYGDNPMVLAVGKLAIAHFTLAAEAESPLEAAPRDPGDLPVRGSENWLYQLSRALVSGVPRSKVDRIFDNLRILNFNYDRSLETYMPWALNVAFGMSVVEAQQLVAEKLSVVHAYGLPGQLDWQSGTGPKTDFGAAGIEDVPGIVEQIRTLSERLEQKGFKRQVFGDLVFGKRLLFLGFDFDPINCGLLFDSPFEHHPEVYISSLGVDDAKEFSIRAVLRGQAKIKEDGSIRIADMPAWQLLRDYSAYLES